MNNYFAENDGLYLSNSIAFSKASIASSYCFKCLKA